MSTYISNRELGEGLTRHYLENAHVQMAARCIDIEGLANYLGMTVVFETFAEEDRDKVGFLADGRTPLKIRRKGSIVSFCFPLGTIVLDSFLRQDKESGRRRFTIAHEIAHSVIEKHNPVPQFHRIYDSEHGYTFQELKAQLTMTENQADRLAAVILMPQFTVDQALRDFNKGRRIKVYGQNVYANEERRIISRMAAQVGVSFSAMQIRLRELDLLEYHPLDEYVEKNLLGVRLMSGYTCNPRYNMPPPDVLRKLELSRLEAENVKTREMRCPICGFLVRIIPVTQTDIVFVKCRKCKFDGALSPAYFRRVKRYQAYQHRLAQRLI